MEIVFYSRKFFRAHFSDPRPPSLDPNQPGYAGSRSTPRPALPRLGQPRPAPPRSLGHPAAALQSVRQPQTNPAVYRAESPNSPKPRISPFRISHNRYYALFAPKTTPNPTTESNHPADPQLDTSNRQASSPRCRPNPRRYPRPADLARVSLL